MVVLSDCLCAAISDAGLTVPCFCGVLTGDQAVADFCGPCDQGKPCGMAWVRMVGITPVPLNVGAGGSPIQRCMPPLDATIEVGIMRCAPLPDEQGNLPSAQAMLLHAEQTYADMAAALRAITCDCTGFTKGDLVVEGWSPVSEQGGCSGGIWLVTMSQSYG